ncbi:MAG TPA: DUF58 domain-containing protein [Candidatus Acidoferrales bacterium]|nr:DUF58 domain-containing protein [Candidatus Acidoferrales bacterium]
MAGPGLLPTAGMLRAALLRARRHPALSGPGSVAGRRGDGYEFVELRAYQPGDDPRRIDWAATARSGDAQIRVMREENPLELAVVVDDSASMRVGRARTLAESAGDAATAWLEMIQPGDRAIRLPAEGNVARALTIARRALRRSAALLVVSDFHWIGDRAQFVDLALALARRIDVTALVTRDPWSDGLPLRGFVRVRDAESGRVERLFVGGAERERYRLAVLRRERDLAAMLEECGWRAGRLLEEDGRGSLYEAFGLM